MKKLEKLNPMLTKYELKAEGQKKSKGGALSYTTYDTYADGVPWGMITCDSKVTDVCIGQIQ